MALVSRLLGYATGHVAALDGPFALSVPVSISLNVVGLIFLLFASITFNFPTTYPIDHETMNYTSAAIGVVGVIGIVTWFTTGRKQFTGPADMRNVLRGAMSAVNEVTTVNSKQEDAK